MGTALDLGLSGKRVLVTAASKGLGRAIASAFVQAGAMTIICARTEKDILATAKEIGATGYVCDITQADSIAALLQQTGSIDILIANAGGPKAGSFMSITDQDWQEVVDLNLLSVIRLVRGVLPHMQQQHWGRIICMTSSSVKQPIENLITSNAVRAAVANLAKTLANEVGKDGVTVNTVAPGMFDTDRLRHLLETRAELSGYMLAEEKDRLQRTIPANRFGSVEELAATVVFMASQPAGYINGVALAVDGGLTKSL